MRKRGIDKDLVLILTTTLITVAAWVGFEVYRAYTRVKVPEGLERYLEPIDPTLSVQTLDKLEGRL